MMFSTRRLRLVHFIGVFLPAVIPLTAGCTTAVSGNGSAAAVMDASSALRLFRIDPQHWQSVSLTNALGNVVPRSDALPADYHPDRLESLSATEQRAYILRTGTAPNQGSPMIFVETRAPRHSQTAAGQDMPMATEVRLSPDRAMRLRPDEASGDIVLIASIDHSHDALTTYSPPLPLIPAGFAVDQSHSYRAEVRVTAISHPGSLLDSGSVEVVITRKADQYVHIAPIGDVQCICLETKSVMTLGRASVHEEVTAWYGPDQALGLTAQKRDEVVQVFGPIGWHTIESRVLLAPPRSLENH